MTTQTLGYLLGSRVRSLKACQTSTVLNQDAESRWEDEIESLVKEFLPSGSGFDSGTQIVLASSSPARLVFQTSFHHMNQDGVYTKWTDHRVYCQAEFDGMAITVSGPNADNFRDYVAEAFHHALGAKIDLEFHKDSGRFTFKLAAGN